MADDWFDKILDARRGIDEAFRKASEIELHVIGDDTIYIGEMTTEMVNWPVRRKWWQFWRPRYSLVTAATTKFPPS